MTTTYWVLWGPASPGPPTIRCRGFMLLREAELSGTGVPGWHQGGTPSSKFTIYSMCI
uniref:Uncharacterized protein n=1 Tax=Hyaloperonospora arabidopsidis (strain Emoy2) TaxID=559515 RepID=M4BTY3_HYAAE